MAVYRKQKKGRKPRTPMADQSPISPREMEEGMSETDIDKVMSSAPEMEEGDMADFPQSARIEYKIPNPAVRNLVKKIKPNRIVENNIDYISRRDKPTYTEDPNSEKNIMINRLMKSLYEARNEGNKKQEERILKRIDELVPLRVQ